ncbi:metal-dependent transcriptional regulator [bacterium]|nr:metal-dependent transcriptional regulator [bacterium]
MSPHKPRKTELSSNMEDYLETIYLQDLEGQAAKVKNIADAMGVSKPSVTEALSVLQDRGLVLHQKYGDIELTEKGRVTAEDIYYRHQLFHDFFLNILGVSEEQAEDDACKVEHLVSDETTKRVEALLEYLKGSNDLVQKFHAKLGVK